MRTILLLSAVALLIVGCGQASEEATQAESPAQSATEAAQQESPKAEATTASTTISGELGCGHCNYEVGESCSAAIKTASGEIYILEDAQELFDKRFDGGTVEVAGTVVEKDGTHHMKVDSYEM